MLKRRTRASIAAHMLLVAFSGDVCFGSSSSSHHYNNGDYNNHGKYGSYYNNNYDMKLDVCSDSVVYVTSWSVSCDSPYTFYYGNGAHRNSPLCDYGDRVALNVNFQVVDDLQDGDNEIYFTLAAFDDNQNLLDSTYPELLCQDYVGSQCIKKGSYSFVYKLKFNIPNGGDRTQFIPVVQMAFSTQGDSGYNLGAVNLECVPWDQDYPIYMSWGKPKTKAEKSAEFMANYGMLLGTIAMISTFVYYVWKQSLLPIEKENDINDYVDPDAINVDSTSSSKIGLASLG